MRNHQFRRLRGSFLLSLLMHCGLFFLLLRWAPDTVHPIPVDAGDIIRATVVESAAELEPEPKASEPQQMEASAETSERVPTLAESAFETAEPSIETKPSEPATLLESERTEETFEDDAAIEPTQTVGAQPKKALELKEKAEADAVKRKVAAEAKEKAEADAAKRKAVAEAKEKAEADAAKRKAAAEAK